MLLIRAKQQGLSLIELLVALALAASLSTAIYQIVLSNKVNIELVESHSKVQESARVALNLMARDLRMAGYLGCVHRGQQIESLIDATSTGYDAVLHDYTNLLEKKIAADDSYDTSNGKIGGVMPIAGSDVFYSRGATTSDLYVQENYDSSDTEIVISGPTRELVLATQSGAILMVTDCETAKIFAVSSGDAATGKITLATSVAGGPDNTQAELGSKYDKGSQVFIMNSFVYFIGESPVVKNKAGGSVNSLFKHSILGGTASSELVPYMESLQFTYGVDTNGDKTIDAYEAASALTASEFAMQVQSLQLQLDVAGDVNINANNADGYLRKTYERVIHVRNSRVDKGVL